MKRAHVVAWPWLTANTFLDSGWWMKYKTQRAKSTKSKINQSVLILRNEASVWLAPFIRISSSIDTEISFSPGQTHTSLYYSGRKQEILSSWAFSFWASWSVLFFLFLHSLAFLWFSSFSRLIAKDMLPLIFNFPDTSAIFPTWKAGECPSACVPPKLVWRPEERALWPGAFANGTLPPSAVTPQLILREFCEELIHILIKKKLVLFHSIMN